MCCVLCDAGWGFWGWKCRPWRRAAAKSQGHAGTQTQVVAAGTMNSSVPEQLSAVQSARGSTAGSEGQMEPELRTKEINY